jgi:ABC-type nitrate/sulfonate/bicarbonate transport system substrate-binding protein
MTKQRHIAPAMVIMLVLAACTASPNASASAPAESAEASEAPAGEEISLDFTTVGQTMESGQYEPAAPASEFSVGIFPVFDESLWWVADELGYLGDVNATMTELRTFDGDPAVLEATAVGGVDLGGGSVEGVTPLAETLDNIRLVIFQDAWKGFAFMVRPGEFQTYEEILEDVGDQDEAARMTAAQFEGKNVVANLGIGHEATIEAALSLADLTMDDITITDLPTIEGATAFLRGEGDIYLGDLPSRFRLTEEGNVPLLAAAQIGPEAVAYVCFFADEAWISENEDQLLRLLGAWYRVADQLRSAEADAALEIMYTHINEVSGAEFDLATAQWVNTDISPWFTFEETGELIFTPGAEWDLHARIEYQVGIYEEQGTLEPGTVTVENFSVAEQLYERMVELKEQTEADLTAAAEAYNAGDRPAEVRELIEQAKWNWDIRNYVDSAALAAEALAAAE